MPFYTTVATAATYGWLHRLSAVLLVVCCSLAVIIVIVALLVRKKFRWLLPPLFVTAAWFAIGSTAVFAGSTVFLSATSPSRSAVSWKASAEFWACGEQMTLRQPPKGMSNFIGSTPFLFDPELAAFRYEGIPGSAQPTATLGGFMEAIGGSLTANSFSIPLDAPSEQERNLSTTVNSQFIIDADGGTMANFANGKNCKGSPDAGVVQVFVFTIDENKQTYSQQKIQTNPQDYTISPERTVTTGDCVIIEFDAPKNQTEHLCKAYGQRDTMRCAQYGVPESQQSTCDLRQASNSYAPQGGV